jgi:hypothetical protein
MPQAFFVLKSLPALVKSEVLLRYLKDTVCCSVSDSLSTASKETLGGAVASLSLSSPK